MKTTVKTILIPTAAALVATDLWAQQQAAVLEEVVVTGTQIKGAAISEALAVSVFAEQDIESMGISSVDELLDRARAESRDAVRIVHGIGTGALRSAVREHLAGCAACRAADVTLKDYVEAELRRHVRDDLQVLEITN